MIKNIHVYDLDGTLINSAHRYRNLSCGSIDLGYWREKATPENIARDTLLPLAEQYKQDLLDPKTYVIIATARAMQKADFDYVREHLGKPDHYIFRQGFSDNRADHVVKVQGLRGLLNLKQFRDCARVFWDDNPRNTEALKKHLQFSVVLVN